MCVCVFKVLQFYVCIGSVNGIGRRPSIIPAKQSNFFHRFDTLNTILIYEQIKLYSGC